MDARALIAMENVTLYGFHRSTYVSVARLVLAAKQVAYRFHDTEEEMHSEIHARRHPFGRVPVLQHGGYWPYETSAIALYVDEAFPGPRLQPVEVRRRARMRQWMGNLDAYFYPAIVFYLVHERLVFAELDIPADERIVQAALPRIEHALGVMESQLEASGSWLVDEAPTLADYFLLPTITALSLTPEGRAMLEKQPRISAWQRDMGSLAEVREFRALLPPRTPIAHARRWATEHRPGVL